MENQISYEALLKVIDDKEEMKEIATKYGRSLVENHGIVVRQITALRRMKEITFDDLKQEIRI